MTAVMDFSHVEQVRLWLAVDSHPVAGVADALLTELVDEVGRLKIECHELKLERAELKKRLRRIALIANPARENA